MQSITDNESEIAYIYNGDGLRTSKTVNGTKTEYYYNGSILAGQKSGENTLVFMYDNNSDIFGFIYNGTEYYYIKNAQNDVIAIADAGGNIIANYYYDAWGKLIEATGNTEIAELNPIRYRSYYYDSETEWYYLNTRYYSADMCRFISVDSYVQTGQGVLDKNMFAYCGNNPTNRIDLNGNSWADVKKWISNACNKVKTWVYKTFGAGTTVENHSKKSEIEHAGNVLRYIVTIKTGSKKIKTVSKKGNSSKPISVYAKGRTDDPLLSSVGLKINAPQAILGINLGMDDIGISISTGNGDVTNSFAVKVDITQLKLGFEVTTTTKVDEYTYTTNYTNASVTVLFLLAAYGLSGADQSVPSASYNPSPAYGY